MEKHDVVIIGGGVASLSASRYLELAGIDYIVIAKVLGGNMFSAPLIMNFPTYDKIEGSVLATKMVEQTNPDKIVFDTVTKYYNHTCFCESGEEYYGKAIIVATGSNPVRLPFEAPCIEYCCLCEGYKYRDKNVLVLGSGESAISTALYLSNIAKTVTIILRHDSFKASEYSQNIITSKDNIYVMKNKTLESIEVTPNNKYVFNFKSKNDKGEETVVQIFADGVFPCLGASPATDFLKDSDVFLDNSGYIIHGNENIVPLRMQKYYTGTSEWGVFAAGDCLKDTYKQFIIASSSGVTSALDVIDYLKGL